MNNLKARAYSRNRNKIETSYRQYLERLPHSEDKLLKAILEFAGKKITGATFGLKGSNSAEDYAQEVAIEVWGNLDKFSGNVDSFYPWLHRICYTAGTRAYNNDKGNLDKSAPLFVEDEDGDEVDNPVVHGSSGIKRNGKPVLKHTRPVHRRELPEFIQGTDLKICQYIREGYDYSKIGEVLSITEVAVTKRIAKIRKKIEDMKNAKSKTA